MNTGYGYGFHSHLKIQVVQKSKQTLLEDLFFLKKIFGGYKSFLWGHWYPCFGLLAMSPLGFKAKVDPLLACFVARVQWIPEIHLWCNTCWLYRGHRGSWAILIHIPADIPASIGGGLGLKPTTICAASMMLQTTRPLWFGPCWRILIWIRFLLFLIFTKGHVFLIGDWVFKFKFKLKF